MQLTEGGNAKIEIVTAIAAAYFSNNHVQISEVANVISTIGTAVDGLLAPTPVAEVEVKREPAVSVKKSITPDFLICLHDGLKFKSLKRHLRTKWNQSPEEYRAYFDLPADYPMVAASYAEKRSQLAKSIGLGTRTGPRGTRAEAVTPVAPKATKAAKAKAPKATVEAAADTGAGSDEAAI